MRQDLASSAETLFLAEIASSQRFRSVGAAHRSTGLQRLPLIKAQAGSSVDRPVYALGLPSLQSRVASRTQNSQPSFSMKPSRSRYGILKCSQIFGILTAFGLNRSIVTTAPSIA